MAGCAAAAPSLWASWRPKWPEANTPQVAGALFRFVGDEEASLVSRSEAAKSVGAIERGALTGNAGAIAQAIGGVPPSPLPNAVR